LRCSRCKAKVSRPIFDWVRAIPACQKANPAAASEITLLTIFARSSATAGALVSAFPRPGHNLANAHNADTVEVGGRPLYSRVQDTKHRVIVPFE